MAEGELKRHMWASASHFLFPNKHRFNLCRASGAGRRAAVGNEVTTVRIKRKTDGGDRHDRTYPAVLRRIPLFKRVQSFSTSDTGILFEERWVVKHLEVLEVRMTWGGCGSGWRGSQREWKVLGGGRLEAALREPGEKKRGRERL